MPTWSIGNPATDCIEIDVLSRPAKEGGDDWVSARVHLNVGGFRGGFDMTMLASEMRHFKDALEPVYRDVRGVAEFRTMEDQLHLKVQVDKLGHVSVKGHAVDRLAAGTACRLSCVSTRRCCGTRYPSWTKPCLNLTKALAESRSLHASIHDIS